jgi:hypothetical protein
MLVRLRIALFSLAVSGVIAFLITDKQALTGLSFTTINRVIATYTMPILVIQHIAMMEGLFFVLGFLGLLLCGRQRFMAGLLLFGSALLAPLYHIYKGEMISLDKHLAFSMFFLAPLAGFSIVFLAGLWKKYTVGLSWFAVVVLCLFIFPMNLLQAQTLYEAWPSSTQLTASLRPRVQKGSGHYLAEDFDVLRYNLKNETDLWQWSSLDYFVYTNKARQTLYGEAAYNAAIQEGYFNLIELSYGYHSALATQIAQNLIASQHYDLVAQIPFHDSYGDGYFWVWSKHAGVPNSTT